MDQPPRLSKGQRSRRNKAIRKQSGLLLTEELVSPAPSASESLAMNEKSSLLLTTPKTFRQLRALNAPDGFQEEFSSDIHMTIGTPCPASCDRSKYRDWFEIYTEPVEQNVVRKTYKWSCSCGARSASISSIMIRIVGSRAND
jgi:hypothetical protein